MPLLSIVVPTLRRADTLRHALATLTSQSEPDCEFIVQNNGNDPAVTAVVCEIDDLRLRIFSTPDVLVMAANWELALSHSRGEYIAFIGDDDGFLPEGCTIARQVLTQTRPEILSWQPDLYYWPSYFSPLNRNTLEAALNFQTSAETLVSAREVGRLYRGEISYSRMPMIYNSFIRRDVVERVKARSGRYFMGLAPDVTSGVANALVTETFLRLSRPLSISGLSGHSTGHSMFFERSDPLTTPTNGRDFGAIACAPELPGVQALQLFLANDLLTVAREMFPRGGGPTMDFRALARAVAGGANLHPATYDRTVASAKALADLHGFDVSEILIPAKTAEPAPPAPRLIVAGPHKVRMRLSGQTLNLSSIFDAARLVGAFIPGADAFEAFVAPPAPRAQTLTDTPLSFASTGDAVGGLLDGWSDPEPWGVWSVADTCRLRFRLPAWDRTTELNVTCRAFVPEDTSRQIVECRVGDSPMQAWVFTADSPTGLRPLTIDPAAADAEGEIQVEFRIAHPRLGGEGDPRRIGLGLERIEFAS